MHACMHAYIQTYVHAYIHTALCIYAHIYIYIHSVHVSICLSMISLEYRGVENSRPFQPRGSKVVPFGVVHYRLWAENGTYPKRSYITATAALLHEAPSGLSAVLCGLRTSPESRCSHGGGLQGGRMLRGAGATARAYLDPHL